MFSVSYERGVVFRPVRFSVSVSNFFRFPAKMCGRTVCGVHKNASYTRDDTPQSTAHSTHVHMLSTCTSTIYKAHTDTPEYSATYIRVQTR